MFLRRDVGRLVSRDLDSYSGQASATAFEEVHGSPPPPPGGLLLKLALGHIESKPSSSSSGKVDPKERGVVEAMVVGQCALFGAMPLPVSSSRFAPKATALKYNFLFGKNAINGE